MILLLLWPLFADSVFCQTDAHFGDDETSRLLRESKDLPKNNMFQSSYICFYISLACVLSLHLRPAYLRCKGETQGQKRPFKTHDPLCPCKQCKHNLLDIEPFTETKRILLNSPAATDPCGKKNENVCSQARCR